MAVIIYQFEPILHILSQALSEFHNILKEIVKKRLHPT